MTNLLFSIVVTLVTNTSEQLERPMIAGPCPDGRLGCAVFHGIPDPYREPERKTITTTICRVTNAVEVVGPANTNRTDVGFEFGRERISETTETLQLVVKKEWQRQSVVTVTNWPTWGLFATNTITNIMRIGLWNNSIRFTNGTNYTLELR